MKNDSQVLLNLESLVPLKFKFCSMLKTLKGKKIILEVFKLSNFIGTIVYRVSKDSFLLEVIRLHHGFLTIIRSKNLWKDSNRWQLKGTICRENDKSDGNSINYPNNNKRRNLKVFEDWQPLILVLNFAHRQ